MSQPHIYSIETLPDNALPEESMICWINTIYEHYDNINNFRLINARKSMIIRLYQIRLAKNNNLTDDEKYSLDEEKEQIQFDYEESLRESVRIACLGSDYKTMYLTIRELDQIHLNFSDEWMNLETFYETLSDLMTRFLV